MRACVRMVVVMGNLFFLIFNTSTTQHVGKILAENWFRLGSKKENFRIKNGCPGKHEFERNLEKRLTT